MRAFVLAAVAAVIVLGIRFAPVGVEALDWSVSGGGVAPEAEPGVRESPVFTIIDVNTYEVEGASEDVLLAGLRALGPRANGAEFFGLTETQMTYRYWKDQTEDEGCRLEQIRVDLNVTITLPRWKASRIAPYRLRRSWDRFDRALRRHEDGHREIAEWSAREVYHALRSLRAPTCETVDTEAHALAMRLREVSEQRQKAYDHQTGHGRTQGAIWPQRR